MGESVEGVSSDCTRQSVGILAEKVFVVDANGRDDRIDAHSVFGARWCFHSTEGRLSRKDADTKDEDTRRWREWKQEKEGKEKKVMDGSDRDNALDLTMNDDMDFGGADQGDDDLEVGDIEHLGKSTNLSGFTMKGEEEESEQKNDDKNKKKRPSDVDKSDTELPPMSDSDF